MSATFASVAAVGLIIVVLVHDSMNKEAVRLVDRLLSWRNAVHLSMLSEAVATWTKAQDGVGFINTGPPIFTGELTPNQFEPSTTLYLQLEVQKRQLSSSVPALWDDACPAPVVAAPASLCSGTMFFSAVSARAYAAGVPTAAC